MDGAMIDSGRMGDLSSTSGAIAPTSAGLPAVLTDLGERVRGYLDAARSANTHRAYRADWEHFVAWCASHELAALPAEASTLVLYLTAHAETLKPSTLQRRLVSIAQAHRAAGLPTPTTDAGVTSVWRGIRRRVGTAQVGKAALLTDDVRAMVGGCRRPRAAPVTVRCCCSGSPGRSAGP